MKFLDGIPIVEIPHEEFERKFGIRLPSNDKPLMILSPYSPFEERLNNLKRAIERALNEQLSR